MTSIYWQFWIELGNIIASTGLIGHGVIITILLLASYGFISLVADMYIYLFTTEEMLLWHPDSPGVSVPIQRSRFGSWFKPTCFATLSECLKSYRPYRVYKDE